MIDISELKDSDKGRWVVYRSGSARDPKLERGKLKSWSDEYLFIVYACDDDWDEYERFTAAATDPRKCEWSVLKPVTQEEIDIVEEHGKEYTAALLPADIERGPTGACFDWNVLQAAKSNGKYRYVEGIATNPSNPHDLILHAWLTDGVHAFDSTWRATKDGIEKPVPVHYFGIEIPILAVYAFMQLTGYQSVIGNRHMAPAVLEDVLKNNKRRATV